MPLRFRSRRAVLGGGLALLSHAAEAHAILEDSTPKAGDTVPAGTMAMRLRFNSRIDKARSSLTLTLPDQTKIEAPIDAGGPPDILTATVALAPGAHTLRWQVLAIDGHITRGDVAFSVTER